MIKRPRGTSGKSKKNRVRYVQLGEAKVFKELSIFATVKQPKSSTSLTLQRDGRHYAKGDRTSYGIDLDTMIHGRDIVLVLCENAQNGYPAQVSTRRILMALHEEYEIFVVGPDFNLLKVANDAADVWRKQCKDLLEHKKVGKTSADPILQKAIGYLQISADMGGSTHFDSVADKDADDEESLPRNADGSVAWDRVDYGGDEDADDDDDDAITMPRDSMQVVGTMPPIPSPAKTSTPYAVVAADLVSTPQTSTSYAVVAMDLASTPPRKIRRMNAKTNITESPGVEIVEERCGCEKCKLARSVPINISPERPDNKCAHSSDLADEHFMTMAKASHEEEVDEGSEIDCRTVTSRDVAEALGKHGSVVEMLARPRRAVVPPADRGGQRRATLQIKSAAKEAKAVADEAKKWRRLQQRLQQRLKKQTLKQRLKQRCQQSLQQRLQQRRHSSDQWV